MTMRSEAANLNPSEVGLYDRATADQESSWRSFNYMNPTNVARAHPELYFGRRGDEVLVVEPNSASWGVFPLPAFRVIKRLKTATAIANVQYQDQMELGEFTNLIKFLFRKNMISINGQSFWDTSTMWRVQKWPHFINIHMTEACNFACKYCYARAVSKAPRMSEDMARLIVRRIIKELPREDFLVEFHGGEPTLNLPAILAAADECHKQAQLTGKLVRVMMQTNGSLLTKEVFQKLTDAKIQVGVSCDGPEELHNLNRVYYDGRGTWSSVMRGIENTGRKVGVLAVVHKPEKYVEVLDFVVKHLGMKGARVNYSSCFGRAIDAHRDEYNQDRAEYFGHQWLKMTDYALDYQRSTGTQLTIADMDTYITNIVSKARPHMCNRTPCGLGNSLLTFNHKGDIYICDELCNNDKFKMGNMADPQNLAEVMEESPVVAEAQSRSVETIPKCSTCTWRHFHGGGCSSKTYDYYGTIFREDPMCHFYPIVYEELMWKIHKNPELSGFVGNYKHSIKFSQDQETARAVARACA